MPQRNRNNIPDLLRTMSVKVSVIDGKISNGFADVNKRTSLSASCKV